MTPVLGALLSLLGLEALLLILFPERIREILGNTPAGTLRVVGIIEAVLLIVLVVLVLKS